LQFAILGQSEMSIPPDSTKPIAYTQVDVEATYSPSQGALEVYGVLSPNSYVLSTSCHLTGGFAYILKDSGNFVLTFGGYAPLFNYAALNYPAVPRLQILWQVDDHTCIKGDEYFALTPAVMMAGGSLQATWSCGIFAAWFTVDVNMFMQWKPFYYEAGFSMSLGVSFDLRILFVHIHFTFHVGAALQVEGPPFHGTAHIDLSVISFTVDFGPSAGGPSPLDWSHFRNMLPAGGVVSVINTINTETESPLLATKVTGGLVKDLSQKTTKQPTDPDWVVNGTHFEFALHTSLPITEASTNPISTNENPISPVVTVAETPLSVTGGVGILPMGITCINGTLDVVLTGPDGVIVADTDATSPLVVEAIIVDMAPAHWATSQPTDANTAPLPMTGGYRIYGGRPDPDTTVPVSVSTLLSQPVCITAVSNRPASAQPF